MWQHLFPEYSIIPLIITLWNDEKLVLVADKCKSDSPFQIHTNLEHLIWRLPRRSRLHFDKSPELRAQGAIFFAIL